MPFSSVANTNCGLNEHSPSRGQLSGRASSLPDGIKELSVAFRNNKVLHFFYFLFSPLFLFSWG